MQKKPFPELGLSPELLAAVTAQGYDQPSPIQSEAIPSALEGRDVVGQSQTGSGKTMAFAIPVVQRLNPFERGVRALILCPTRELAMQVCTEVAKLTTHKPGLRALPIYGGATFERQIRGLKEGAQIVVGTPGRLLDFLNRGLLKLEDLQMLVFDEADEMLDMGFRDDIEALLARVPPERQTLFFSATLDGAIGHLVEKYTRNAKRITIAHQAMTVPTVEQRYFEVQSRSKVEVLCRLLDLEAPRLSIIFANTKRAVDDATDALVARGFTADRLHGDLNQVMRDRVMRNFRSSSVEVLVATDVAARGLDIDEIDLVVNFDLPYDEEDYVHRIGRTGRAGRKGLAISLVGGRELFLLQRIQRFAKVRIDRHAVPTIGEVDGMRVNKYFEKLRATLEEGKFTSHDGEIQKLLDAGHESLTIASALMHLWANESGRDAEAIPEDRFQRGRQGGPFPRPVPQRPVAPPPPPRAPRPVAPPPPVDSVSADAPVAEVQSKDPSEPAIPFEKPPFVREPDEEAIEPGNRLTPEEPILDDDFGNRIDAPAPGRRPRTGRDAEGAFTRLFINIGAMDNVAPREIAGAIYRTAGLPPGSVGKIEIYEKCSYVGISSEHASVTMEKMNGVELRGRQLRMDHADASPRRPRPPAGRAFGNPGDAAFNAPPARPQQRAFGHWSEDGGGNENRTPRRPPFRPGFRGRKPGGQFGGGGF